MVLREMTIGIGHTREMLETSGAPGSAPWKRDHDRTAIWRAIQDEKQTGSRQIGRQREEHYLPYAATQFPVHRPCREDQWRGCVARLGQLSGRGAPIHRPWLRQVSNRQCGLHFCREIVAIVPGVQRTVETACGQLAVNVQLAAMISAVHGLSEEVLKQTCPLRPNALPASAHVGQRVSSNFLCLIAGQQCHAYGPASRAVAEAGKTQAMPWQHIQTGRIKLASVTVRAGVVRVICQNEDAGGLSDRCVGRGERSPQRKIQRDDAQYDAESHDGRLFTQSQATQLDWAWWHWISVCRWRLSGAFVQSTAQAHSS